jgi:hypothetical protein
MYNEKEKKEKGNEKSKMIKIKNENEGLKKAVIMCEQRNIANK